MQMLAMLGYGVLRRVVDFFGRTEVTTALGSVTTHVAALGSTVDRFSAHAVEQDANDRGFRASARGAQQLARTIRGEFMRPVAEMGKVLFPSDPSLRQGLAMPKVRHYQGLIAAGSAMAARAEEHKERFVAAGFAEDFIDRFRKAVEDLRILLDLKAEFYGRRTASSAGMLDELGRGRSQVRMLDAMVAPRLAEAPEQLAQWRSLSRFVRRASAVEAGPVPAVVVPPIVPVVVTPNVAPVVAGGVEQERAA